jgi:hypothetical protein
MDLEKFKEKYVSHWAEELEPGDICKATIRHKTDGSKNRQNVKIFVVSNFHNESRISGWDRKTNRTFSINYNELTKIDVNEPDLYN